MKKLCLPRYRWPWPPPPPLLWPPPPLPPLLCGALPPDPLLRAALLGALLAGLELLDEDRSRTIGGAICSDRGLLYPGLPLDGNRCQEPAVVPAERGCDAVAGRSPAVCQPLFKLGVEVPRDAVLGVSPNLLQPPVELLVAGAPDVATRLFGWLRLRCCCPNGTRFAAGG